MSICGHCFYITHHGKNKYSLYLYEVRVNLHLCFHVEYSTNRALHTAIKKDLLGTQCEDWENPNNSPSQKYNLQPYYNKDLLDRKCISRPLDYLNIIRYKPPKKLSMVKPFYYVWRLTLLTNCSERFKNRALFLDVNKQGYFHRCLARTSWYGKLSLVADVVPFLFG